MKLFFAVLVMVACGFMIKADEPMKEPPEMQGIYHLQYCVRSRPSQHSHQSPAGRRLKDKRPCVAMAEFPKRPIGDSPFHPTLRSNMR